MNTLRRIGTDLRKSIKAMTKTRDTEARVRPFITLYEYLSTRSLSNTCT